MCGGARGGAVWKLREAVSAPVTAAPAVPAPAPAVPAAVAVVSEGGASEGAASAKERCQRRSTMDFSFCRTYGGGKGGTIQRGVSAVHRPPSQGRTTKGVCNVAG